MASAQLRWDGGWIPGTQILLCISLTGLTGSLCGEFPGYLPSSDTAKMIPHTNPPRRSCHCSGSRRRPEPPRSRRTRHVCGAGPAGNRPVPPRGRTPPARPRDRAAGNGPHAPRGTRPGPRAWPNGSFRPPKVKAPSATEGPRRCPLPCPPRQAGLAALLTRKAAARAAPQLVSHTGTSGTYARSHPALSSRQIICRSTFVFRQKAQTSRSEVSKPQVRLF